MADTTKKMVQVLLSDSTHRMLKTLAAERELSKSDIIRQAIKRECAERRITERVQA